MSDCPHCRNGWFEPTRFGEDVECVNGVLIDIDVAHDGWDRHTNYPLAPCHPDYEKSEEEQINDSQERLADWAAIDPDDMPQPDPRDTELTELRATVARLEAEKERMREALKPFVNLLNSFEDRYLRRGGDPHSFPDTHPSFDITAYDLRIGCWRAVRAALDPQP